MHRVTGVVLSVGAVLLVLWLVAAASGPKMYADVMTFMSTTPVILLLAAWSFCFFFHFFNGLRHLLWDIGHGFELRQVSITGWTVVIMSFACTGLFWAAALGKLGGGP